MTKKTQSKFNFNISLSILNHLGRKLYRSFITILGEAISNSWDADAKNVWITINIDENYFVIKDDGTGMTSDNFQQKFLKIGYTKRKKGIFKSPGGRPFIGRKGIGKLALLSCAQKINITTKTVNTDYVGGTIDNNQLDQDIIDDINAQDSKLGEVDNIIFSSYVDGHTKGTIIFFEDIHDNIKKRLGYIKKLVALYFRFSLVDTDFNIHINDKEITVKDLQFLAKKTHFLWKINSLEDPYLELMEDLKEQKEITLELPVKGFIASVDTPRSLTISAADERTGVDLFVNGRLREKNILGHFSTFSTRIVASYLYGQIHLDKLDLDGVDDKFTSAREGVIEGDKEYEVLLRALKEILNSISDEWDEWRIKHRQDGDNKNLRKTPKQRAAITLFNIAVKDYTQLNASPNKAQIDGWIQDLTNDAEFNTSAYVDCFLSENLLRKYISNANIDLSISITKEICKWKKEEIRKKKNANIFFDLRRNNDSLSYLGMDFLVKVINSNNNPKGLLKDSKEFKPIRNVVGHTGLLTKLAKEKLNSTYENIKIMINELLS